MLKLPPDGVIHSFRHTFGTRLGETGADAFTIMRVMGHSSVTVSQKYVHPNAEALGLAMQRLEAFNQARQGQNSALPTTIFTTVSGKGLAEKSEVV